MDIAARLLDAADDLALLAVDARGAIRYWSVGASHLFGYSADAAETLTLGDLRSAGPEDTARLLELAEEAGRVSFEEEWRAADGRHRRVDVTVTRIEPDVYAVTARDLAARARSERAVQDRTSLVKLLQAIAETATHAETIEQAIHATLEVICVHTGWPVGHAYLLDEEGVLVSTRIWHLSEPERYGAFRRASEGIRFSPGEGIPGEVIATGHPVWVPDLQRDPLFLRREEHGAPVGAAFALPILADDTVIGVLEFFAPRATMPHRPLMEVLEHVGEQLGRVVERTRSQAAVRLSEAKFAGIVSIASDGIVSIDESQRITLFNAGAEQIFGYTAAEVLGQPLELLIPPAHRPGHAEHVRRFGDSGVAARRMGERGQVWGLRKNGEVFPADASISRIEVGGRRIYTAVLQDATERHRAEAAVAASEAKFAGIVGLATDAVVSVDREQRIVVFNRGAEVIFGYAADEVLGERLELLLPGRFRGGHSAEVAEFGRSGVPARRMGERGEIRGRRKNGEEFPAEASISRLELGDEVIYTAVLRDVTEARRAEEALRAQAEELARSNRELEQFAYVASHDLQEPLRKIQAFGDRLESRYGAALEEQGRDYIARMQNAAGRMQGLINDLLTFSRVTTQAQPMVELDLEEVVRGVVADLETRIEQTGGSVEVGSLPRLQADALQMRQLFQNLIGNALKFRRPEEPPRVVISARDVGGEAQGEGACWEIAVADNGIGFEEKYLDRIFALFQRLHGRGEFEGTGMGLAICRKIAERHAGTITARSAPDQGSTFLITLPTRQETA